MSHAGKRTKAPGAGSTCSGGLDPPLLRSLGRLLVLLVAPGDGALQPLQLAHGPSAILLQLLYPPQRGEHLRAPEWRGHSCERERAAGGIQEDPAACPVATGGFGERP